VVSLNIRTEDIFAVLLHDGWHEVNDGTFHIDAYEFIEGSGYDTLMESALLYNGERQGCSTGFSFCSGEFMVDGPMTSIIAVRRL
jgi:hypothetical protein